MRCGVCGSTESSVLESRPYYGGKVIVRRRQCACGNRWTTDEKKRRGSDSHPWPEAHPSNSGSKHTNDPPVIAGQLESQPTTGGVSLALGGIGGGLPSVSGPDPSGPSKPDPQVIVNIMEVFAHYRTHHPKAHRNPRRNSLEWRKIRARFEEGFSVDELKRAIDGYHKSKFHLGDNDTGQKHLGLDLIMRDESHVNKGLGYLEAPAAKSNGLPKLSDPKPTYCDWHIDPLRAGKPTQYLKSWCPDCKHLAARSNGRSSDGPVALGDLFGGPK